MTGGKCEILFAPIAVRLTEEEKKHLEPDLIVVCDPDKLKEDGCHGAPDMVIEIGSGLFPDLKIRLEEKPV